MTGSSYPSPSPAGNCLFCKKKIWAACDNTNPNAHLMEAAYGYSGSGLFGYSHMMGGYAGGQAQYVRVPFANVGPLKIESDLPDEKVLFLSDIFPTGYMAAENAQIQEGDTVAVWGADQWVNLRSPARLCWVRRGSLPLIDCRNGWRWLVRSAQSPSTIPRKMSAS